MSVRNFSIAIPSNEVEELENRIRNTRLAKDLKSGDWERGINGGYLLTVINFWKNSYKWDNAERKLNSFHHFKTTISGIDIHFIHERGKGPNSIPIILTHGWPDTFLRYTKLIPLLTDPGKFGRDPNKSFDVIIPSLPGFGFSGYSDEVLINNETIAEMWLELMTIRLGYQKFLASGGDIGSSVTRYLSFKHPHNLLGIYLTDVGIIRELISPDRSVPLLSEDSEYSKSVNEWLHNEAGYMNIQATKPQTLTVGLSDSPVGLAAWLLEKFYSWRDLTSDLSLDEILTNIMIYWFNNNISTASRIYYENSHFLNPIGKITVPTGICLFPTDILLPPRKWVEDRFQIIHWKSCSSGGHFTAMENPEEFADNLFIFVRNLTQL